MSPAEYPHVGVFEAELAEMWALLEDENDTPDDEPSVNQSKFMPMRAAIPSEIGEQDMES